MDSKMRWALRHPFRPAWGTAIPHIIHEKKHSLYHVKMLSHDMITTETNIKEVAGI